MRQLDGGHRRQSELVECDGLPSFGLLEPELSTLAGSGEAIEERDDMLGVAVRLLERSCEQRPGDRAGLDVSPLG